MREAGPFLGMKLVAFASSQFYWHGFTPLSPRNIIFLLFMDNMMHQPMCWNIQRRPVRMLKTYCTELITYIQSLYFKEYLRLKIQGVFKGYFTKWTGAKILPSRIFQPATARWIAFESGTLVMGVHQKWHWTNRALPPNFELSWNPKSEKESICSERVPCKLCGVHMGFWTCLSLQVSNLLHIPTNQPTYLPPATASANTSASFSMPLNLLAAPRVVICLATCFFKENSHWTELSIKIPETKAI